jgi:hypothetical protein
MLKPDISKIVLEKLNDLNSTLPSNEQFLVSDQTILFGMGSCIDSLSLVSIIVDIEMHFNDLLSYEVSLTDDNAMSREKSPFNSVSTLVDYIDELINSKNV